MEQQATRTTDGASTRELLQMEHISKSFPGVKALDDVSLTVKAGTVLCVLEAMKMQSNYKVNADCIVRNILVSEGEPVNANQVLIELELIKEE